MDSKQIASISEKILMKIAETGSVRDGYDAVMGRGEYDKMAGKMYDELRAKAEK